MFRSLLLTAATMALGFAQTVPGGGAPRPGAMGQPGSPASPRTNDRLGQPGPPDLSQQMQKADDQHFAREAAVSGMTEVEMGKLAAEKASSDAVKQFAQKMVDDHSRANEELKTAAAQDGISVPDALDSKHQSRVDKMARLSGPTVR